MTAKEKAITREGIARKVRELRQGRGLTQDDLSRKLGLSQGRYSVIERGQGSFSAEQLLEVLRLFNIPASAFYEGAKDVGGDLQNALARFGASHLLENSSLLPSERLEQVERLVLEVLINADAPRQITALAPVLLRNLDKVNLNGLWARHAQYGIERRLGWVLENLLEAVRRLLVEVGASREGATLRKAAGALDLFLSRAEVQGRRSNHGPDDGKDGDILGLKVTNPKTIREVWKSSSDLSRKWGIICPLQPEDFVDALVAADVIPHR